jgi:chromosome segregation ATPase
VYTLEKWTARQLFQELAARVAATREYQDAAQRAAEAFDARVREQVLADPKVAAARAERDRLTGRVADMRAESERNRRAAATLRAQIRTAIAADAPDLAELEAAFDAATDNVKKLTRRLPDVEEAAAEAARRCDTVERDALHAAFRAELGDVLARRQGLFGATAELVERFVADLGAAVAAEREAFAVLSRCMAGCGVRLDAHSPGQLPRLVESRPSGKLPRLDQTPIVPIPYA